MADAAPDRIWITRYDWEFHREPPKSELYGEAFGYVRSTPASAARLLLESPEAVERMARAMSDMAAVEGGGDPDQAWRDLDDEDRAFLQKGARAALRAIAGEGRDG